MSIVYKCKHCEQKIGRLEKLDAYQSKLGLDILSMEDQQEMIQHQANGDVHINIICESCEETLDAHPQYHELDFFIQ